MYLWTLGLSSLLLLSISRVVSISMYIVYKTPISTEADCSCISWNDWFEFSATSVSISSSFSLYVYKTPISTEAECSCISGRLVWVLCYLCQSLKSSFSLYVYKIFNNHDLVVLLPHRLLQRKEPWTGLTTSLFCIPHVTLFL